MQSRAADGGEAWAFEWDRTGHERTGCFRLGVETAATEGDLYAVQLTAIK